MAHNAPAVVRRWPAALILTLFAVAVAGAAFIGWRYARESPPHLGPIVLVSFTGLHPDQLTTYGSTTGRTPAIDALANDAVVFDRAYAHSLQTLPAHASMFTGQLPIDHGVRNNAGFTLRADVRTLAELLRNRGFATGAAVSSFLLRRETGVAQGFTYYDADLPEADVDGIPAVEREGLATVDAAERWLRTQTGQRFFLFVQTDQSAAEPVVARVVEDLKKARLYDSATILLIGDYRAAESGADLTQSSLRIPLIVKQPASAGAGRHVSFTVQQVDLLPTILDLVRAPIPSGLRGRSVRTVLDKKSGVITERPVYAESLEAHYRFGAPPVFALTNGRLRYIRDRDDTVIDLEGARGQRTLDSVTPQAVALHTALDQLLHNRPIETPAEIAPSDEDRYAALGYLEGLRVAARETGAASQDERTLTLAESSAAKFVAQKKFSAGIDALKALARREPMLAVLQYQLGSLLERTGRLEEAAAAFRTASKLNPDAPEIRAALSQTLVRLRKNDDAAEQADLAVALAEKSDAPARAAAHEAAAIVALARKDTDSAVAHAGEANKADPALPLPQFIRGRTLYDEGHYEEALAALQEADAILKQHNASIAELHYYLADTLARLDRYVEAEMEFREELRLFPREIRSYASLAMLYRASNREGQVEQVIRDLMEAAPTPEGYALAARLWMILGDRSRAESLRSAARTRFRGDPSLALLERQR